MRKIRFCFIAIMVCLLLCIGLSACSNSFDPYDKPDNNTQQEKPITTQTVNLEYVCGKAVVGTFSYTKRSNEDLDFDKFFENIPDDYVQNLNVQNEFSYGDIIEIKYNVKHKYENYMQITTTDSNTNERIIPFSTLGGTVKNLPYTVYDINQEPVTIQLSKITEIKIFNAVRLNKFAINPLNNLAMTNLVKVDLTDCVSLESLPQHFFSLCPALTTVISNGNTKNLMEVGSHFLSGVETLTFIDFDFSNLQKAGNYFLMNSLINYSGVVNIDLSNIVYTGIGFLFQCSHESHDVAVINLYLSDKQWNNEWFDYNTSLYGSNDYTHSLYGKGGHYCDMYTSLKLNIYTNYKANIETAVSIYLRGGATISIYDIP